MEKRNLLSLAFTLAFAVAGLMLIPSSASASLPSPWQNQDMGDVGQTGSADYSDGTFTVEGGSADIWGTND